MQRSKQACGVPCSPRCWKKPNAQFCDVLGRGRLASAAAIMSSISSVGTRLGGRASGALPGRWWGAFSEGGRNRFEPLFRWFYWTLKLKIKPVRPLKSVLDNYNFLSSHVYSNGAQAVVIWDSRRFATPPSARASPTKKRSNPARIWSPVKSNTLQRPKPPDTFQNGMKTRSKTMPSWFSTKEGSGSLNGTIFSI